jgi:acyl carrier protein
LEELVDSMARIEIIFELEDKYGVEIEDAEVLNINTVDDIIDCVEKRLLNAA